jgi:hypothetical protein
MTATAATPRKHRLHGAEDGATAVEAALVLSLVVGVVLIIIDFAQAFFIWNTLQLVVGQASRYVMVQTSIPPGSPSAGCPPAVATSCAVSTLTMLLPDASSSCSGGPTPGQYCVSAGCTSTSCSLSAMYGFKFLGVYTLMGQITVPIGLPPDHVPPE